MILKPDLCVQSRQVGNGTNIERETRKIFFLYCARTCFIHESLDILRETVETIIARSTFVKSIGI